MTLPIAATKTHLDHATDDPKQARVELAALVDRFNELLATLGGAGNAAMLDSLRVRKPTATLASSIYDALLVVNSALAANDAVLIRFEGSGTHTTLGLRRGTNNTVLTVNVTGTPIDALTILQNGQVRLGTTAATGTQSDARLSARGSGNGVEFGHSNSAGYGSVLGAFTGSGSPALVFNGEISDNDITTRGIQASFLRSDNAGGVIIGRSASGGTGTSAPTELVRVHANGGMTVGLPAGGSMGAGTLNLQAGIHVNGVAVGNSLPAGYTSAQQTITAGGALTLTHGLGAAPSLVIGELVCLTAEHGYSVGDRVAFVSHIGALNSGVSLTATSTSIKVQYGSNGVAVLNASGVAATITTANWRVVVRAWI